MTRDIGPLLSPWARRLCAALLVVCSCASSQHPQDERDASSLGHEIDATAGGDARGGDARLEAGQPGLPADAQPAAADGPWLAWGQPTRIPLPDTPVAVDLMDVAFSETGRGVAAWQDGHLLMASRFEPSVERWSDPETIVDLRRHPPLWVGGTPLVVAAGESSAMVAFETYACDDGGESCWVSDDHGTGVLWTLSWSADGWSEVEQRDSWRHGTIYGCGGSCDGPLGADLIANGGAFLLRWSHEPRQEGAEPVYAAVWNDGSWGPRRELAADRAGHEDWRVYALGNGFVAAGYDQTAQRNRVHQVRAGRWSEVGVAELAALFGAAEVRGVRHLQTTPGGEALILWRDRDGATVRATLYRDGWRSLSLPEGVADYDYPYLYAGAFGFGLFWHDLGGDRYAVLDGGQWKTTILAEPDPDQPQRVRVPAESRWPFRSDPEHPGGARRGVDGRIVFASGPDGLAITWTARQLVRAAVFWRGAWQPTVALQQIAKADGWLGNLDAVATEGGFAVAGVRGASEGPAAEALWARSFVGGEWQPARQLPLPQRRSQRALRLARNGAALSLVFAGEADEELDLFASSWTGGRWHDLERARDLGAASPRRPQISVAHPRVHVMTPGHDLGTTHLLPDGSWSPLRALVPASRRTDVIRHQSVSNARGDLLVLWDDGPSADSWNHFRLTVHSGGEWSEARSYVGARRFPKVLSTPAGFCLRWDAPADERSWSWAVAGVSGRERAEPRLLGDDEEFAFMAPTDQGCVVALTKATDAAEPTLTLLLFGDDGWTEAPPIAGVLADGVHRYDDPIAWRTGADVPTLVWLASRDEPQVARLLAGRWELTRLADYAEDGRGGAGCQAGICSVGGRIWWDHAAAKVEGEFIQSAPAGADALVGLWARPTDGSWELRAAVYRDGEWSDVERIGLVKGLASSPWSRRFYGLQVNTMHDGCIVSWVAMPTEDGKTSSYDLTVAVFDGKRWVGTKELAKLNSWSARAYRLVVRGDDIVVLYGVDEQASAQDLEIFASRYVDERWLAARSLGPVDQYSAVRSLQGALRASNDRLAIALDRPARPGGASVKILEGNNWVFHDLSVPAAQDPTSESPQRASSNATLFERAGEIGATWLQRGSEDSANQSIWIQWPL